MPIYEYRRPDGSTFEVMQSFSEDPLTHDPETGVQVQRVLHAPAVHFKGSGFYNTDYGTKRRQRESAANGSDASGGEGGGDSKPASADGAAAEKAGSPSKASESSSAAKPEPKKPKKDAVAAA